MSENDIRVFIVNKVKELTIGKEATKGFVNSIKRVLEHMVKEGFLEFNPAGDIEPKDFFKYSTERVRPREKVVVNDVRWDLIEEMLDETIRLKPYYACVPLAVKFARRTGMRVAEIAALRWDHVYEDHFHIDSSEKTSRLTNEVWIGPTKNTDVRDFPITEEIQEILDQCKFYSERFDLDREWVFVDVSGRIHSSVISSCLRNKCRQLQRRGNDVPEIGIHCLRRTLNSKMHNQGVCTVTAATLLGHSEDVNRHYYTFDVTDNEEKRRIVSDVLKNR